MFDLIYTSLTILYDFRMLINIMDDSAVGNSQ